MSNPKKSIKNVRVDYKKSNIDFLSADSSPYDLFNVWIKQAFEVDKDNANAFVLSTVSKDLIPSSRVVLLRGFTEEGLVFFTNYDSQKSKDIFISVIRVFGYCPLESFSTDFNISKAHSKPLLTPHNASISTPVFQLEITETVHLNPFSSIFQLTLEASMGILWQ